MNTDPTPQPALPVPQRRRWLRRLALGAAITLAVLLAGHLVWYLVASAGLRSARRAAEAAGLSQDPARVIPPPCPDADNAALRYQQAYGLLTLGGKPYVPQRDAGALDPRLSALIDRLEAEREREAIITSEREALLALLDHEDFARAWRLVAEGARLPRCRFENRYEAGACMLLPQVTLIRNLARLGSLRARLLAAAGRPQEAAAQFADLLAMLRQYREEPILISLLVSLSVEKVVLADLRQALEDGLAGGDAASCARLLDDGREEDLGRQALRGECALFGTWAFRNLGTDAGRAAMFPDSRALGWFSTSWISAPLLAGDEACYLRVLTGLYIGSLPPGQEPEIGRWHPITGMLVPAYGMIRRNLRVNARLAATARLALAAAAGGTPGSQPGIAVQRGADGAWVITPAMEDLVPATGDREKKALAPWRIPARR